MVRCADCGLLGTRLLNTLEIIEVDEHHREKWEPGAKYQTYPICSARVLSFQKATENQEGKTNERIDRELRRDRVCDRFIGWTLNSSPKEHAEMQTNLELRKWQEAREDKDRREREAQETQHELKRKEERKEDRDWQQKQLDWQESQNRWNRGWQLFVGVVILVIGYFLGVNKAWPPLNPQVPEKPAEPLIQK